MSFLQTFLAVVFGIDPPPRKPTKIPPVCPDCDKQLAPSPDGTSECRTCGGRWLNNESFQQHLANPTPSAPESYSSRPGLHTYERSRSQRRCPACESLMDNYQFAYQSGIWIDACPDKHGVWLDAGELPLIRDYHQRTVHSPMTSGEKAKMAMAFLDGATESRRNMNAVTDEIRRQDRDSDYDY